MITLYPMMSLIVNLNSKIDLRALVILKGLVSTQGRRVSKLIIEGKIVTIVVTVSICLHTRNYGICDKLFYVS